MKKCILLCAVIGMVMAGVSTADAATITDTVYNGMTHGLATGDTVDVSNTTNATQPHFFGVYAQNYVTDFSAIDNVTVKSAGYAQSYTGWRIHGDAIRTNNLYNSTGAVKIGNGWMLATSGYSADGVNLSGYSSFVAGDNLTITIQQGAIPILGGDGSYGLRANHSNKMTIGKSLDITTQAAASHGIYMNYAIETSNPTDPTLYPRTGSEISIDQYSRITTNGNNASAAYIISSGDKLYVQSDAEWTTKGSNSHVLYVGSNDNVVQIGDDSTLKSTGSGAHVVNLNGAENANITFYDRVNLSSANTNAYALNVNGGKDANVIFGSEATLNTTGSTAYAVNINNTANANITFGEQAAVKTIGANAHAIRVNSTDNASVILGGNSSVVTEKDNAYGLYINGNGTSPTATVSIGANSIVETSGDTAHAVYMRGVDSAVEIGGGTTVSTKGTGSHALYGTGLANVAGNYGENGKISVGDGAVLTTSGSGSHAVYTDWGTTGVEFKGGANISVVSSTDSYALYANAGKITSNLNGGANVVSGGKFMISGDMKTDENGVIDLMMTDGSLFTGKTFAGSGDITLDLVGTQWNLTGSSDVTKVMMGNGTNVNLSKTPFDTELHVGTLTTKNPSDANTFGTFTFKTDIVNETANRLVVDGTTDGYHKVSVVNDGTPETTGNERVMLIETADKGGNFSLTNKVELGAFQYDLYVSNDGKGRYDEAKGGNGQYWELARA